MLSAGARAVGRSAAARASRRTLTANLSREIRPPRDNSIVCFRRFFGRTRRRAARRNMPSVRRSGARNCGITMADERGPCCHLPNGDDIHDRRVDHTRRPPVRQCNRAPPPARPVVMLYEYFPGEGGFAAGRRAAETQPSELWPKDYFSAKTRNSLADGHVRTYPRQNTDLFSQPKVSTVYGTVYRQRRTPLSHNCVAIFHKHHNMTSSIKPEVHNLSQRRQRKIKPRP